MPRRIFPKQYSDLVARLRVPSGFLLIIVFVWLSKPTLEAFLIGLPFSVAGLLLRAWAAGHLAKNRRLVNTGPYAHLRNPLYLGTLMVAAGLVIASREPLLAIVFGAVFVLIYLPVIQEEENHLRDLFPEFAGYAARVPLLRPRLQPVAHGEFRWALYRKNEEYNALLGFLAGAAILLGKAYWLGG